MVQISVIVGFLSVAFLIDGHYSFTDSSMPVLMLQTGNTQPLFSRHINMSEKTHVKQRTECLGALNTHT